MHTPIQTIQSFLGEPLSIEATSRLAQAPADQLDELSGRLADARTEWFSSVHHDPDRYYVLDIVPHGADVDYAVTRLKGLLLYFQRVAIPDPLAYFDNWISFSIDQSTVRAHFLKLLTFLTQLAPLITTGDVLLVPSVAYKKAPFAAQIDAEISKRKLQRQPPPQGWAHMQMVLHGHFCAEYEYIPLATSRVVAEMLDSDLRRAPKQRVTGDRARIASVAMTYRIPGTQKASVQEVLELRKNEEIFAEFRSVFGNLLARAHESSTNEESFQVRLRELMDAQLRPLVRNLKDKLKRPSLISDLLIPGAASLGGTWLGVEIAKTSSCSRIMP